jgi:hypothetical protein
MISKLTLNSNSAILLCTCYRPPSGLVAFWDRLAQSIETALDWQNTKAVVIVGDLNDDLLNPQKKNT